MKYILLLGLFVLSPSVFSQKQKSAKYLPNELQYVQRKGKGQKFIRKFTTYSEVFVRFSDAGRYRVEIGDQGVYNDTGMFCFFDLEAKTYELYIYEENIPLYKTEITLRNGYRLILDYSHNMGLFVLDEVRLGGYGTAGNEVRRFPHEPRGGAPRIIISDEEFENFLAYFQKQSFDDNKLELFKSQSKTLVYSTHQIIKMMKLMSFDKNKLILAKQAYEYCLDPYNYYQVGDAFDFSSSAKELNEYIAKYQR